MKTMMTLLFAGAMSASGLLAATNDQWAEERLKAKMGRYSPAEEARREALAPKSNGHDEACKTQGCCCQQHASAKDKQTSTSSSNTDNLLAAKLGRRTAGAGSTTNERTLAANCASASPDAWWRSGWGRSITRGAAETQTAALVASERSEKNPRERATCCD